MLTSQTPAASSGKKPAIPLRRATYVTIDKLVNSQYNFDLNKLNDELFRLRSEHGIGDAAEHTTSEEKENLEKSLSTSRAAAASTAYAAAGVANLSIERKKKNVPSAWENPLTTLPSAWQPSHVLPPQSFKFHTQSNRLQPPRDGFNLCVLVGKVDVVVDKLRVDGSRVLVAEVQVGDNTGSLSLRARDEQIDVLQQISKNKGAVVLRNCTVELHQRKFLRLAVSKWGKMKAYPDGIESTPDPPLNMNEERNFSLVDLNMVATAKENILPSQPINQHPKQQQHHRQMHQQGRGNNFEGRRSPGYHQRGNNRKYQNQRRMQQPSMYSPPRAYYEQQYYPPYSGGDGGSVYSYQSHSTERTSPPPHGQAWQHHPQYQNDYNSNQQHQLMYQQYALQQRHAHQMQMLQDTQRRLMAVEHQRMGGHHPQGINMVESHESNEDYAIPSTIAMAGSFPPPMLNAPPPMGYPYSPQASSPMRGMMLPGEQGIAHQRHQVQQGSEEPASNATVVSPPGSPERFGQGVPPSGYADPLLYFDQSSIPLTGMQEPDPSANDNEEQHDENIQF